MAEGNQFNSVQATRNFLQQALSSLEQRTVSGNTVQRPTDGTVRPQQLTGSGYSPQIRLNPPPSTSRPQIHLNPQPSTSRPQIPSNYMVQRPSWFNKKPYKKKSKKIKLSLWEHECICLAHCRQVVPPSPMEKIELIRAGLGPKKVQFLDYGEAWEFHDEMVGAFPQLSNCGGYELLRTQPQNSRELFVIPSQSGGYTVQYLKSIVCQAKVYIRPIQKDLSLVPLVEEKDEMGQAPNESCMKCGENVPMHLLRKHVEICGHLHREGTQQEDKRFDTEEYEAFHNDDTHTPPGTRSPTPPGFSPITPSADVMDNTAADSGLVVDLTLESDMVSAAITRSLLEDVSDKEPECVRDVVLMLQKKSGLDFPETADDWIDVPRQTIDVRRGFVVTDALRESKKRRFDHTKLLRVSFVGEAGVDTGGPSREFWRLFSSGVAGSYCINNVMGHCFLDKNVPALQREDFNNIGKLVSMCIVQGGSGLPIFHPSVYHYMESGEYIGQIMEDSAVADGEVRELLQQIDGVTTDEQFQFLFDEKNENRRNNASIVCDTGYRKPLVNISVSDKGEVKQILRDYNTIIKTKAEMDQFCSGLDKLHVLDMVKRHPSLMSTYFVPKPNVLSKEYFKSLLTVTFCERDPLRRAKEEATYLFFMDFIDECEDGTAVTEDDDPVKLEDVLVFFTGAATEPPLGFSPDPTLIFCNQELATASTCDLRLRLPYILPTYKQFRDNFILSLKGHDGLGVA